MRSALKSLRRIPPAPADCGAAGTTFRFLALRASRIPGRHILTGTTKLFERPQEELRDILDQLGVRSYFDQQKLMIESEGWRPPRSGILAVNRARSSQFASAVLLNAWGLDFDLNLRLDQPQGAAVVSQGYFDMTMELVRAAGMQLSLAEISSGVLRIERGARVSATSLTAESDLSSCFAVAALASIDEESKALFDEFPGASLQPDRVFPEFLARMGVAIERPDLQKLLVRGARELRPIDADLRDCPDLFPVLAVLCSLANGRSVLSGAPHLIHKESDRISAVAELVSRIGAASVERRDDGLVIHGRGLDSVSPAAWTFDPRDDHRLAMAAALARLAGSGVEITRPEVVNKSFPEFWDIFERGRGKP